MAANRIEGAGAGADTAKGGAAEEAAALAPAAAPGGVKAWVPMIATLVTMPALAYAMTTFVLMPKLRGPAAASTEAPAAAAHAPAAEAKGHGSPAGGEEHGKSSGAKSKYTTQLNKVIVNVAGTMGTRFLVVSMTLVSKDPGLDDQFKENEPELRHLAITSLSSKAIADIEKPGAKNLIRSELASLFNTVLGSGVVQEIYFTDFAIQ